MAPSGESGFTKIVTGVITILAVATIGGYLGVEALETTARSLWEKRVEGKVDTLGKQFGAVHDDVDIERLLRETRKPYWAM